MLRKLASRAAIAAASLGLVVVAACSFKADIVLTRSFTDVTVTNGTYDRAAQVDLAAEAPGAWKRRSNVKSLDLVAIEAAMTNNHTHVSVPVSGELYLERNGTIVHVGTWSKTIAANAPDSIAVTMPESGNALILDALRGDGKFTVRATATTAGSIDIDVTVTLHVGINYDVKP